MKERLSKKQLKEAKKYGGADPVVIKERGQSYSDKGGHKARSEYHRKLR